MATLDLTLISKRLAALENAVQGLGFAYDSLKTDFIAAANAMQAEQAEEAKKGHVEYCSHANKQGTLSGPTICIDCGATLTPAPQPTPAISDSVTITPDAPTEDAQ